ncbi:MAG: prephenate dehydratase domain-containing protein, partial [Nitrosotalea sp.]
MLKVAFQGEPGAYSQAAAVSFFKESIETVPYPTFYEALG